MLTWHSILASKQAEVQIINKGTTRNDLVMQELQKTTTLFWLLAFRNFDIAVTYLEGLRNTMLHAISRLQSPLILLLIIEGAFSSSVVGRSPFLDRSHFVFCIVFILCFLGACNPQLALKLQQEIHCRTGNGVTVKRRDCQVVWCVCDVHCEISKTCSAWLRKRSKHVQVVSERVDKWDISVIFKSVLWSNFVGKSMTRWWPCQDSNNPSKARVSCKKHPTKEIPERRLRLRTQH